MSKATKKSAVKPAHKVLSAAQRSEVARAAAFKAWQHKSFQSITAQAAKRAEVPLKQYIRERNAARSAA